MKEQLIAGRITKCMACDKVAVLQESPKNAGKRLCQTCIDEIIANIQQKEK